MATLERALRLLQKYPRISLSNITDFEKKKNKLRRGQYGGNKRGVGDRGQGKYGTLPRIGFEGNNTPFYLLIPKEPYYRNHHVRREYVPLSLLELQRMVDLGRLRDSGEPLIDMAILAGTGLVTVLPDKRQYGIDLTDQGADVFSAKVNIEVQWASETTIAAVERNGGMITTRYFDPQALRCLVDAERFFRSGAPVPMCKLPPADAIAYYTDPQNRGYLADPAAILTARAELAQKYGYKLPAPDDYVERLKQRKDPRQVYLGLEPGWLVNLVDRTILKPTDMQLKAYYRS